jgi:O-antigen ligase
MLGVVVGLLLVFSVAWPAFNYAALSGYLGEAVREKQLWQTSSREGFLATARPHTRFELEAISDAPFVGSGSIPQNAEVTGDLLHAAAIDVRDYLLRQLNREDIQTHSFIFDNWIRAGILGGLSWFVVSIVIVRSMFLTIWYGNFPGYACSYLMFLLAWNIFFSPMAPQARLFTAISIVVVFSLDAALLSARRDARRAL